MKRILTVTACGLLAPLIIWCEYFLAGIIDVISPYRGWIFFWILCAAVTALVLLLEKRFIPKSLTLACNIAYFLSGAFYIFVWLKITEPDFTAYPIYDSLSRLIYGWDYRAGTIWLGIILPVLLQLALHLIIRIIIAIVRTVRKKKTAENN